MTWIIEVCGEWAGSVGGWRPAISGALNQSGESDETASTFATQAEAVATAEALVLPGWPEEWRVRPAEET